MALALPVTDGEPEGEFEVEGLTVSDALALREAKVSVAEADALPEGDNLAVFVVDADAAIVVLILEEGETEFDDDTDMVKDTVNEALPQEDGVTEMPADFEAETLGVPEGDNEAEPEVECVSVTAKDAETDPEEADEAEMVMHPVADPESAPLFVIEAV